MVMDKARLNDEALDWVIRLGDRRFADWDALTTWLALSADRARAFNALQLAETEAVEDVAPEVAAPVPDAANDNLAYRFLSAGIAGKGALLAWPGLWLGSGIGDTRHWQEYRTAAGARRDLRLADGIRFTLNSDTVVRLDPGGRGAALVSGEGLFVVRHDAARPFVVTAGGVTITDASRRFDVVSEPARLTLSAAKGLVAWARGAAGSGSEARLILDAGQGGVLAGTLRRRFDLAPEGGANRGEGRLRYEDVPVSHVLADVARSTRLRVPLETPGESKRSAGTISLDGPPEWVLARVRLLPGAGGGSD